MFLFSHFLPNFPPEGGFLLNEDGEEDREGADGREGEEDLDGVEGREGAEGLDGAEGLEKLVGDADLAGGELFA